MSGFGLHPSSVTSVIVANVKNSPYNAAGNGVTDDAAALQSALDAVNTAGGGVVYLAAGTYIVGTKLTIGSKTTLLGDGAGMSIIKAAATLPDNSPGYVITNKSYAAGNTDITLRGIEVDANKASRSTVTNAAAVIFTTNAEGIVNQRINVIDCYVHDSPALGLVYQRVAGGLIRGNHVANDARDGITCYFSCSDLAIVDNWVHDCADDFIGLNSETGTGTGAVMKRIIVRGNRLGPGQITNGSGVAVRGATDVLVEGNVITEAFSAGVTVSNYNSDHATDVVIADNVIRDAGKNNTGGAGHGISIDAGATGYISGGNGHVRRVTVRGNKVITPRAHGITAASWTVNCNVEDLTVQGNEVTCSALYASGRGIYCWGSNMLDLDVSGNRVQTAQDHGIVLGSGSGNIFRPTVIDNRVYESGQGAASKSGIYFNHCADVTSSRNRVGNRSGTTQAVGITYDTCTGVTAESNNLCFSNSTADFQYAGMTVRSVLEFGGSSGGTRRALYAVSGTPEGAVSAAIGSLALRIDGGASTSVYVKESGTGNTGWIAK